jgi:hypothetical protein
MGVIPGRRQRAKISEFNGAALPDPKVQHSGAVLCRYQPDIELD